MTVRVLLLAAVGLLAAGRPAPAQTFTWDGGAGNGNWSSAANWAGDVAPPSGPGTVVLLNGTVQTTTTQNLADPFVLNQLNLGPATGTNGFVVNGSRLQFAGAAASINTNVDDAGANQGGNLAPAAAAYQLRVNAPVDFAASTTINSGINYAAGAEVVLAGPLTAAAGVTLTLNNSGAAPGGTVVIASSNNAGVGNLTLAGGSSIYQLAGVNALSRQTVVSLTGTNALVIGSTADGAGPGFTTRGSSQQLARVSGLTNIDFPNPSAATLIVGFDNGSYTHSGIFNTNSTATTTATPHYAKVGTGTLTYIGNNGALTSGFSASLSVRDGTVVVSGANGRFADPGVRPDPLDPDNQPLVAITVGGTQVFRGATLILNNAATANQDRLQNTGTVSLAGGSLILTGNSGGNVSEQIGPLRLAAGESTVEVGEGTPGGAVSAGRAHRFLAASLTQASPTATLFLRATNLGAADVTTGSAVGGITFSAAPTGLLVGGGGPGGTPATSILPFVTGAATAGATSASGFVTYVGGDGTGASRTRLLDGTEYAMAFGTATDNVAVAGVATVLAPATANSVLSTGGIVLNGDLIITSGAFLSAGSSTVAGPGTLRFGPAGGGPAYLSVGAGTTLAVSAPAVAARLVKSGGGVLTVQAPVALGAGPTVAVNAGALAVLNNGGATTGGFAPASGGVTFQVSRGATLDYTGVTGGLALAAGAVVQGAGRVAGPLTVGPGATLAPSGLGGTAASLASPGTLTADGVRLRGGGTYRWHLSSVLGGPYTQSLVSSSAGVLDLSDPTLTAANPFVVRPVSLTLQNAAGPVYDFDGTQAYTFPLGTFGGGITGFAADKFTVDTADFANGGGVFSVGQAGNTLTLTFTPVPEPGLLLAVAAGGLVAVRRRRSSGRGEREV